MLSRVLCRHRCSAATTARGRKLEQALGAARGGQALGQYTTRMAMMPAGSTPPRYLTARACPACRRTPQKGSARVNRVTPRRNGDHQPGIRWVHWAPPCLLILCFPAQTTGFASSSTATATASAGSKGVRPEPQQEHRTAGKAHQRRQMALEPRHCSRKITQEQGRHGEVDAGKIQRQVAGQRAQQAARHPVKAGPAAPPGTWRPAVHAGGAACRRARNRFRR